MVRVVFGFLNARLAVRYGAASYWRSSRRCRLALLEWRPARRLNHWARELTKLGHQERLMPARDVKAYVSLRKLSVIRWITKIGFRRMHKQKILTGSFLPFSTVSALNGLNGRRPARLVRQHRSDGAHSWSMSS